MKKIIFFITFLFIFACSDSVFAVLSDEASLNSCTKTEPELNRDEKTIEQDINVTNLKELLDEIQNERLRTKEDINELEEVKDSIVDEIKQELSNLQAIEQTKSFYKEESNNSPNMSNALSDVISLKVLKMLDEMTKEEKDSFTKSILKGTWSHKYEIVTVAIILFVALAIVVNSKEIMDRFAYEISNRFINNTSGAIGGSARGGWDAFRNIFRKR